MKQTPVDSMQLSNIPSSCTNVYMNLNIKLIRVAKISVPSSSLTFLQLDIMYLCVDFVSIHVFLILSCI
jgi:hypothetical protein